MRKIFLFSCLLTTISLFAQHRYQAPKDPLVNEKITQWQDLKFGLFMHWGTYSQWGVVESWSLCPEDEGWTQRKGPYAADYFTYKKAYENLQTTFNPTQFNPEKWVAAARGAGMKYVVFTTKHHDGFCMFDTKETDYKITSPNTPFSKNPRSNVALEIFNAFRKENFLIGAYFSKPDWHSANYWWPYFPPKDRNVNYDPKKHPERWEAFKDFTLAQIKELMSGYGKIDILWLDGGWVRPISTVDTSVEWQRGIHVDQDIDMARIANTARSLQPGLIVVDRSVGGEFENYTTPEQEVPEKPLEHPWETCMTMGNSWSFVPGDQYKSSHDLIQLLIKVVSRGGNFLLNIGPGPTGDWDPIAYQRLKDIGIWMKVNGEGIYGSRPVAPYSTGNLFFTQSVQGKFVYAFYLFGKDEETVPLRIPLGTLSLPQSSTLQIMGQKGSFKIVKETGGSFIQITQTVASKIKERDALVFKISN